MSRAPSSIEQIVQNERLSVVLVAPHGPHAAALAEKLRQTGEAQVIECDTAARASMLVGQLEKCVLLLHIKKENEAHLTIESLRALRELILKRSLCVVVTLASLHGEPEIKALRKAGAAAVLNAQATFEQFEATMKRAFQFMSQPRDAARKQAFGAVKLVAALAVESDCWLMAGGGAKSVGDVWHVKLRGPGPKTGSWQAIEGQSSRWQWKPRNPRKDPFVVERGAWVFSGECPRFERGLWHFVGNSLGFFDGEQGFGYKFEAGTKGSLRIARDSKALLDGGLEQKQARAEDLPDETLVAASEAAATEAETRVVSPASSEQLPPIQPLLKPLSLALMMSGWTAQLGADPRSVCEQYCQKLSDSCEGLNIELWIRYGTRWSCVGSSHPESVKFGAMARASSGAASIRGEFAWIEHENEDALLVPIRSESKTVIGAMVVGGAKARALDQAYAVVAARMATGVICSFQEESVRLKERQAS